MSQESIEVVRGMYADFSELAEGDGDVAAHVTGHFDHDCEYQPIEETGTIRGHDGLVRWYERWLEAWVCSKDQVDEVIDAGDMVVTAITVHGRGRESGLSISQRLFQVLEVRGDKILRVREYLSRDQALEAAGLSNQAPGARNSLGRR
jgi:ketosteroid isomerase-like protein